jgi:hypothetical protein
VTTPRRLLLLVLTVSCFLLSVPSAWASFTNRTSHAAVSTFSSTTMNAPTIATVTRCALTSTVIVTWTHSTTAFVASQLVELSTSPTLATVSQSATFANNTTQTKTFSGISLITTYYARVTAQFNSWSKASAILIATASALC